MLWPYLSRTNLVNKNLAFLMALLLSLSFLPIFNSAKIASNASRIVPSLNSKTVNEAEKQKVMDSYSKLPIHFTPNKGQLDGRVKYYATGAGYSFYLTQDEVTYSFVKNEPNKAKGPDIPKADKDLNKPKSQEAYALKIKFLGANPDAVLEGRHEQKGKVNYLMGNDPKKWRTNISTYSQVTYKNLYPGINLTYKGNQNRLKYEFVVSPNADYKNISLIYGGADSLKLDKAGNLLIDTSWGELKDEKSYVYQLSNGQKVPVKSAFVIKGNTAGFSLGAYDPGLPVYIDPGLVYSTFIGGSSEESSRDLALDASGNAYITGTTTFSSDFPTIAGAYDTSYNGNYDAFVTKLNPSGSALSYSTFLGGSSWDEGLSLALDASGNAYITGRTYSPEFPTTAGAYDTSHNGGSDAFVTKLNPSGSALSYSTFLGGSSHDSYWSSVFGGSSLALDTSGNAYITGHTWSTDFPTTAGAYDISYNGGDGGDPFDSGAGDVFVTKLNPSGSTLSYSTFIGGSSGDYGLDLALDASGNAYLTGHTWSTDFPTTAGAYDISYNGGDGGDAFVTKLNPSGSALVYSTFIGGSSGWDSGESLALDASGNAYITGRVDSPDFPTTAGAYDTSYNAWGDAFVTKLNPSGSALVYSTFIGGASYGYSLALDASGNAYITGYTYSPDFPTTAGAYDTSFNSVDGTDAFVTKLNPSGSALVYSTFIGGSGSEVSGSDGGYSLALDASGNVYVAGYTHAPDFPTTAGAYDTSYNGGFDAFVAKLELPAEDITPPNTTLETSPTIPDGTNGWFKTTPSITLTRDEPGITYYSWTSATGPWTTYSTSFSAPEGQSTLYYYSVDTANNAEVVKSQLFKVDTSVPSAPTNLNAIPISSSQIDLSWNASTDNVGVAGYKIYNQLTNAEIATTTSTSYSHMGLSPGTTYQYYAKAFDAAGNTSSASSTVSATTFAGETNNTQTGTNVDVSLGNGVSLTFDNVTSQGTTSVTVSTTPPGGAPSGFRFQGYYYNVTTTASYSGYIIVQFPYNEADVRGREENLKLMHWTGTGWEDVTVSVDTVNNIITGRVTSLSPFAVAEPAAPPIPTGYNFSWLLITAISLMISGWYLLLRGKKRFV